MRSGLRFVGVSLDRHVGLEGGDVLRSGCIYGARGLVFIRQVSPKSGAGEVVGQGLRSDYLSRREIAEVVKLAHYAS